MTGRRIAWPLLCAFVFSIPWEKSLLVPEVGTLSRLLGALAVAAALWRRPSFRAPNLALALAALFAGWEALTYFWSIHPGETAARALTFAQLAIMVWLIWDSCRTAARQTWLLRAYVAGAAVASLLTITRYAQGLQTYYRRYAAAGFDPNDLGLTVALSIPLALYLSLRERGWARWALRASVVVVMAAVLLSASRTSLVVSFLSFTFVAWTWRESDRGQRLAGIALAGLLAAGALQLAPVAARQRLATLPREAAQGTLHDRTRIWKAGLKSFQRHPVVGVGAGAYPEAVRPQLGTPARAGHQYVAHSTWLSVLVECGLIGLGLFLMLTGTLAAFVWFMPLAERALWSVMLAVWAVGITTLTWEHRKPGWLLFALIMTEWARSFAAPGGTQ